MHHGFQECRRNSKVFHILISLSCCRVTQLADQLRIDFALIHRERYHIRLENVETDKTETRITLVGDVKNKICLMMDDVIDQTHSFIDSCDHLKKCEAAKVYIVATHGILSENALRQIEVCSAIDGVRISGFYLLHIDYSDQFLSVIS